MGEGRREEELRSTSAGAALAIMLAMPAECAAQAWVPPAGVGSITFLYQTIDNSGHLLTDGSRLNDGKSTDVGLYVEGEYALTDRFSFSAGLPYVFAKYRGPGETPFVFLPVDSCRCWNHGWADVSATARYNLANGPIALTPSVTIGVPSHHYDYRGEAVVGRHLREVRLGVDAGRRLDRITPNLSVQGAYSYAIVERILDIPNNRSNATLQAGYAVTRRLSAHVSTSWQRTHGGLRFPEVITIEQQIQHDRLLRDNYFHAGAGASYSFRSFDLFASYIDYISGHDSHDGRVYTVGVSVPFERSPRRR